MGQIDLDAFFAAEMAELAAVAAATRTALGRPFAELVRVSVEAVRQGGKLIFFGNGGSAADALLTAPSTVAACIQEMHITLGQMLCGALERSLGLVETR